MLTATDLRQRRRRRPPPSLRQLYQEYVLQRIEAHKNSLTRDELLRLGDEAIAELETTAEEQFLLTEIMMLESVDRLISKRLKIRPFRRWRKKWLALRSAQRQPSHWQIPARHPVVNMLQRLEPGDHVVVIGAGLSHHPCLLAAHDTSVTYLASDMGTVERVESTMVTETLGADFIAYVTQLMWLPEFAQIDLLVLDTSALVDLAPPLRTELVRELQARTGANGVHLYVTEAPGPGPSAVGELYDEEGWDFDQLEAPARVQARSWTRTLCQYDTRQRA